MSESPSEYLPVPQKAILNIKNYRWSVIYSIPANKTTITLIGVGFDNTEEVISHLEWYTRMVPVKATLVAKAEHLVSVVDECNELGISIRY